MVAQASGVSSFIAAAVGLSIKKQQSKKEQRRDGYNRVEQGGAE